MAGPDKSGTGKNPDRDKTGRRSGTGESVTGVGGERSVTEDGDSRFRRDDHPGPLDRWLRPRSVLTPARWSGDPGPRPRRCQWLDGDGPFDEADKCGHATVAGSAYCQAHLARARLPLQDALPRVLRSSLRRLPGERLPQRRSVRRKI